MSERVWRYVERRFARSGNTAWPSVREAARALGCRQGEIEEAVYNDERLFLSYYFTQEYANGSLPLGDYLIESYGAEPTP